MTRKLTYEELGSRVKELEEEAAERKRMEVFSESEQPWRSLLENSPAYLAVADRDGTIQYINRTAPGVTMEEVIGKNIDDFKSPVYHEISRDAIKKVFQFGESGSYQVRALGPNKTASWYEVHFGPIKRDGRVVAIAYSTIDISGRKRVEEALEASEKRYRAVVENQTELICRFLPEGTLTFVNDSYCRYFGQQQEDLVGSQFMPLILAEDREKVEAHFASITPETPVATHEHRVIAGDGTVRWHQWTNQGIFDHQGYIVEYQSVGRDVTEQKQVGKELARIEKLESLGMLAGGIAHDFNNLLTPILSNISLARIYGEVDGEVAEMLADAEKATLRAKSLTQQLLTFSKGGAPVKRAASISKLLEDASTFALSGSNVNCQYSIPEDLWPVEIDEGQIAQVIQNLIINADQAMPRGGTIEIRAENVVIGEKDTSRLQRNKYVRVSIRDQGIGISKEDMANIFDPFFTTKQRGSGLGLSTSFTIVEQHEGTIQVESELGVGTTFHVYLPASTERPAIKEKEGAEERTGKGKLLIVDDEEAVRRTLEKVLRRLGYEARFAEEGAEAISIYEKAMREARPFDVVITDLTIRGGMGGQEAIKRLKQIDPEAKVIVSSGYSKDRVLSHFQEHGFCGVLAKPYQVDDLAEVIHQVLGGARG